MKTTGIDTEQRGVEMSAPAGDMTRAVDPRATGVTSRSVLASEWIKLRSLRSSWWSVTALVMSILLMGAFSAVGIVVQDSPPAAKAIAADPSGGALSGVDFFAQLAVVALGVLAVTGEYRTGMIRASFTAVPNRHLVVWAKAGVVAAVAAVISLVAVLLAFGISAVVLSIEDEAISLFEPGVARAVLGAAVVLGLTGVLGTAFGWLLRGTAGAVSALVGVLYLLPSVAVLLPGVVSKYLPGSAAGAVAQVTPPDSGPHPWVGLAVYAGYAAIALALAAVVVRRRDA